MNYLRFQTKSDGRCRTFHGLGWLDMRTRNTRVSARNQPASRRSGLSPWEDRVNTGGRRSLGQRNVLKTQIPNDNLRIRDRKQKHGMGTGHGHAPKGGLLTRGFSPHPCLCRFSTPDISEQTRQMGSEKSQFPSVPWFPPVGTAGFKNTAWL